MWFNKKQETKQQETSGTCQHQWVDFPAFVVFSANNGSREYDVRIVEPYVCVHCKKRDDVLLERRTGTNSINAVAAAEEIIKEFNKYSFIKPKPVVEDMVTDFQKVDRDYLAWYDYLHGEGPKPGIVLKE